MTRAQAFAKFDPYESDKKVEKEIKALELRMEKLQEKIDNTDSLRKRKELYKELSKLDNLLYELEKQYDNVFEEIINSRCENVTGCCGIAGLTGIGDESSRAFSSKHQAWAIKNVMDADKVNQVVITDIINKKESRDVWAATKAIAFPGPPTVNPKSKNTVRLWVITRDMLVNIFHYDDDNAKPTKKSVKKKK